MANTKGISIRQPWAAMIAVGMKDIEIRTWKGPPKYRGPILIHAGRIADKSDVAREYYHELREGQNLYPADLRGGFIGKAELVDAFVYENIEQWRRDLKRHRNPEGWFQPKGTCQPGLIGIVLASATMIDFIRYRGSLGIFNVDLAHPPHRSNWKPTPYLQGLQDKQARVRRDE